MVVENQETTEAEQPEIEELETGIESDADKPEDIAAIDEGEEEEIVVSIGEETPPQEEEHQTAPEWVRELRKNHREAQKRIRELEEEREAKTGTENKPAALGAKPTLENCDYDSEVYERELTTWFDQKRAHEEAEAKKKAEAEEQGKAWQNTLSDYSKAKETLKVKDFDEAEFVVQENMSATQQGMILQGADNPALVVYALGKNPKKAKEIASITDPVKFAFAVGKLETTLKVSNRKAPPPPEKTISGTGSVSGSVDSTLKRLEEEADRTGDRTKVVQYKKQKRQAK